MPWLGPPIKEPTPSDYAVLVVFLSVVFMVLGVVALVAGWLVPVGKDALAAGLFQHGAWCLGLGAGIAFLFWLFRRLVG